MVIGMKLMRNDDEDDEDINDGETDEDEVTAEGARRYVAEKNTVTDATAFAVSPFMRAAVPCEVASNIPKLVEGLNRLVNLELPASPGLSVLASSSAIKREY